MLYIAALTVLLRTEFEFREFHPTCSAWVLGYARSTVITPNADHLGIELMLTA